MDEKDIDDMTPEEVRAYLEAEDVNVDELHRKLQVRLALIRKKQDTGLTSAQMLENLKRALFQNDDEEPEEPHP